MIFAAVADAMNERTPPPSPPLTADGIRAVAGGIFLALCPDGADALSAGEAQEMVRAALTKAASK
jgi:hypothetical protein